MTACTGPGTCWNPALAVTAGEMERVKGIEPSNSLRNHVLDLIHRGFQGSVHQVVALHLLNPVD